MNWIYVGQNLEGKSILYLIHQTWQIIEPHTYQHTNFFFYKKSKITFPFPICIMWTYVSQIFPKHVSRICNVLNMLRKHINFMVTIYIKSIKVIEKPSAYFDHTHIIFNVFKCPMCQYISLYFGKHIYNIILMSNVLPILNHRYLRCL